MNGPGLGRVFDLLYAAPPGAFVAMRRRLARALTREGRAQEAAAVRALAKPGLATWAVNRVARLEPGGMRALFTASEALTSLYADRGGALSRDALRAALGAQRCALAGLLLVAEAALVASGRLARRPILDRVESNLRWGALTPELRPLLERGWLAGDVPPRDIGARGAAETRGAGASENPDRARRRAQLRLWTLRAELTWVKSEATRARREAAAAETPTRAVVVARASARRAEAAALVRKLSDAERAYAAWTSVSASA